MRESETMPEPFEVPLYSIMLHDVQGLFGGQTLYALANGTAFIQLAGASPAQFSGLWETRYQTSFLLPYLDVETLAEDPLLFLALLHYRTAHEPVSRLHAAIDSPSHVCAN